MPRRKRVRRSLRARAEESAGCKQRPDARGGSDGVTLRVLEKAVSMDPGNKQRRAMSRAKAWHRKWLSAASVVALDGCCAASSTAAAASNICATAGVTSAVAIKAFGPATTVAVTEGMCAITTKKGASSFILLQPASSFKGDLAGDRR
jgi:hypothetical protein